MKIFDSNIIIYLSKNIIMIDDVLEDYECCAISTITYMEVLGYDFTSNKEEEFIRAILEHFEIIYVDEAIEQEVVKIRKNHKIKLPAAIICATAIVHNATLITKDTRLKNINRLDINII